MDRYDVVIIGGGPAGASAALYAARGGLSVAVVDGGRSALLGAERIQNFYGPDTTGRALFDLGLDRIKAVGARLVQATAVGASYSGAFNISTTAGELCADRLVIATGASRAKPDIPGLRQFEGRGVSYCAVCDAFFYRKKRVGVIGAGEFAEHEYSALKDVAGECCLLTDGLEPCFCAKNVFTQKIARIAGDERVSGVEFADGSTLALDGVFVAIGTMGAGELAKSLGAFLDGAGNIIIDGDGRTSLAGLYAAGDCTAGIKQVARAVCGGMNAALAILSDKKRAGHG